MSNSLYSTITADLPPQMVSLTQKDDEFKQKCMDSLEQVGRAQYLENLDLLENYEMIKGKFVYNHYFEHEGYTDFMAQLTREFELPSYLRHYDITSQVVNTLSGEQQRRPDIFRIKNQSEDASNQFQRDKTELLIKYVTSQINANIAGKLLEQGLDPDRQDFQSSEEAQQYQQMVQEARQALTPPEIEQYMQTDWTEAAEIWAQHQLDLDKERFNLPEKEKMEFEDMLVAARCFRHFYITHSGYNQETWNPIQVFYQKSPDVQNIEDGDYVGRIFYLSLPAIIDRYGYKMTKREIESLQFDNKNIKDKNKWNYTKGSEYVFDEYMVPFEGFQVYDTLVKTQGVPKIEGGILDGVGRGKFYNQRRGLYMVTEAYWKSQKKIGRVSYIDPETGVNVRKLVDETFIVPPHFTQEDSAFKDDQPIDSVSWTWVNEIWRGIKINLSGANNRNTDLYLDVNPVEFQFKGDINPYDAKLPVCGQVFGSRNSKAMSLVDLMKPYQIFYNVAMNQLYQIMERETGKFVVMDINMFPDSKDWGGEKSLEKFMTIAKELGVVPADTSPQNTKTSLAAVGGYLPKSFDLEESARMISRLNLAKEFEQMALRQVGFNQYRLGAYTSEATAGGVETGKQASYAQTESLFTDFSNYIRRCHEFDLAIAQYVQSKEIDITVMNIKSDMSRSFIKLTGTDLLLADLHVRVINSQEFIRQLETLQRLAIENNTSGADMLDLTEIITANSPAEIKIKMKESRKKMEDLQQQQSQVEQQKLEQEKQLEQLRMQREDETLDKTLQNKLDVAYIMEGSKILNSEDGGQEVDPNKERQLDMQDQQHQAAASATEQDHQFKLRKLLADTELKNKQLAIQQNKIQADLQIQREKLQVVKTMKSKPTK